MVEIRKGSCQRIAKYSGCLIEVNAMLLAVDCYFGLIPSEFHTNPVLEMSGTIKWLLDLPG